MLAPAILCGGSKSTRKLWRKLMVRAWQAPDDPTLFDLPCISLSDNELPIVVYDFSPGWQTDEDEPVWHFNWIQSCWAYPHGEPFGAVIDQFRIVMNGLRHPWYALGLLDPRFNDLQFLMEDYVVEQQLDGIGSTQEFHRRFLLPFFDRLLFWMTEIHPYVYRFRSAVAHLNLEEEAGACWVRKCLRLAYEMHWLTDDEFTTAFTASFDDALRSLLATGKVVRHDGRLRVAELV